MFTLQISQLKKYLYIQIKRYNPRINELYILKLETKTNRVYTRRHSSRKIDYVKQSVRVH